MSMFNQLMNQSKVQAPTVAGTSFETLLNEAGDVRAEIQANGKELDFRVNQVTSLEAIADQMEASLESHEGMNPQTAAMAKAAVEAITGDWGVEAPIASMESFGGVSDRAEATVASFEGIKEMAKNAWDAIIKMIKDMINKAKAFFAKIFDAAPKIKKRAQDLIEKVRDLSGEASEKKIKIGGASKTLATDKAVVPGDVIKGLPGYELTKFEGSVRTIALGKDGELTKVGEAVASGGLDGIKKVDMWEKLYNSTIKGAKEDQRWPGVLSEYVALPLGNQIVLMTAGKLGAADNEMKKSAAIFNAFAKANVRLEDKAKDFKHLDGDYEAPTLALSEIESVCEAVVNVASSLEKSRQDIEKAYKTQDAIAGSLEKLKGASAKVEKDDKDWKGAVDAYGRCAGKLAQLSHDTNDMFVKLATGVAVAALSYAEKSATQYKKA